MCQASVYLIDVAQAFDNAPPPEIHVPIEPNDRDIFEAWLSAHANRKVRILVPQRGDKREMVELAQRNAALGYRTRFDQASTPNFDALETLKAVLKLPAMPRRIECFDISTIQGAETVASLVVCEDGKMKRGVRRATREELIAAVGAKTATAVLAHFAQAGR